MRKLNHHLLLVIFLAIASGDFAKADILYFHTFNGDGSPLGNVPPNIANTGIILGADHGTSAANWNDAGVNQDGTFDEVIYFGSVDAAPAELPFKPVNGFIYTLKFTGTVSGNGANWLGGGFINRSNAPLTPDFIFSPILYAFTRPGSTDSIKQLASNDPYGALRTTGSGRVGTSNNSTSPSTITIELNTVGGNNSWDVRWFVNGNLFATKLDISDIAQANMMGVGIAGYTVADIQTFSLEVNLPPLTIQSLTPQGNGIYPGVNLTANFSESITLSGTGTITLNDTNDGSGTRVINLPDASQVSVSGSSLIINPTNSLELGANYEVTISPGAIRRSASTVNPFTGTTAGQWTFRTADPDPSAPVLTGRSPADNAINVPYNSNIVATFDDNIVAGPGIIALKNLTNPARSRIFSASDASQITISGKVLTLDPSFPLDADSDYAVQFSNNAVLNYADVPFAGIPESDNTTWNIRTGSPSVVDVLVVYTPAALAHHGTEAGMLAHIQACIAASNDAFAQSGVTGQVRLVGTQLVSYTESSSYTTDLDRLTNTADGFMDNVHTLRNTTGADLVCLLRKGTASATAGLAWRLLTTAGEPNRGFSVVQTESALSSLTFTHELGHNFGLGHARGDSQGDGIFADSVGYRFNGLSGNQYRTIMANSPGISIPRFSNPALNFDGVPSGVGPPSASNSANEARTLSITMPIIAGYRNNPPFWSSNSFSLPDATVGVAMQADLEALTSDPEPNTLTHTLVSGPTWLTMTNSATGRVSGTPAIGNVGDNVFTVRVSDGTNPAVDATMTIKVRHSPTLDSDGDGINDALEVANGTNPLNPRDPWLDADGDWVHDYDDPNDSNPNIPFANALQATIAQSSGIWTISAQLSPGVTTVVKFFPSITDAGSTIHTFSPVTVPGTGIFNLPAAYVPPARQTGFFRLVRTAP